MRPKTKEARAFEQRFSEEVVPNYLPWISKMEVPEENDSLILAVRLDYYFPKWEVLNKGFFSSPRKAKTRYKKMDTGNRFKLIVDCLAQALSVDDSHFFDSGGRKLNADAFNLDPQVHIFVVKQDPKDFGL